MIPILISQCCIVPAMTEQDVLEIRDEWNAAEFMDLVQAAIEVNSVRRTVDWGKG